MWRVLSVFENFRSFVLKVLLTSTGLWDSIRYNCKLSFFHNSLVHSYCHPLQFSFRNSNNLSIRLETPIYYRRNGRWSFVYKPTISIFCRIGKEHFSHFPPIFFLSFALFYTVQIALQARSGPPPPIRLYRLGNLFFYDLICNLKLKFSPQVSDGKDQRKQGQTTYLDNTILEEAWRHVTMVANFVDH